MLSNSEFFRLFPLACIPGTVEPYVNKAEWAIHDVLPVLLEAIGPCELRMITFNVSEESIRVIDDEAERGNLTNIMLLLDTSIQRNKLDLLSFALTVSPSIRLDRVHAKVMLISNDKFCFGIAGSANFNSIKRIESGFYFTAGSYFDYFLNEFENCYKNAIINDLK